MLQIIIIDTYFANSSEMQIRINEALKKIQKFYDVKDIQFIRNDKGSIYYCIIQYIEV